jgi:hypothetical protein
VGIPNLLHFVYKSRSTSQYTSPELEAPYNNPEEEERSVVLSFLVDRVCGGGALPDHRQTYLFAVLKLGVGLCSG